MDFEQQINEEEQQYERYFRDFEQNRSYRNDREENEFVLSQLGESLGSDYETLPDSYLRHIGAFDIWRRIGRGVGISDYQRQYAQDVAPSDGSSQ